MSRHLWILSVCFLALGAGCGSDEENGSTSDPADNQAAGGRWECKSCGDWHEDLAFGYGTPYPEPVLEIPEEERAARVKLSRDFCVIDGEEHFVRGHIEIPVIDAEEPFRWDVWVSLSRENFERSVGLMDRVGREEEPPYYGWLNTELGVYGRSAGLKVFVRTQQVGLVPSIELQPSEHPLCVEQREGISLERVKEIAALILHPGE